MKSYLTFLSRNKLYTSIEVIGMAIAIAFVIFIGIFVIDGYRTDYDIKQQDNIYVADADGYFLHTYPTKDILTGKFPEVSAMCRIMDATSLRGVTMEMTVGDEKKLQDALIADENFFQFFPFTLVEGDADRALKGNSVLLSESCARRYFADQSPLGKIIKLNINENELEVQVTGVFKDFQNTIMPSPEIIYNFESIKKMLASLIHPGNGTVTLFFELMPDTNVPELTAKMERVLKEEEVFFSQGLVRKYRLTRFADIPQLESVSLWTPFRNLVNPNFIRLFAAIGILLLLFAALNYTSLTVAQTGFRAKEMAARRLLGAFKTDIIFRYLAEAFLLTCFAFLISLLMVTFLSPSIRTLVGKEISPFADGVWQLEVIFLVIIILLLSVCSGMIPAYIVSKFQPIDIIRGNFTRSSKMILGKMLIGIQSVFAFVTLVLAITMGKQLQHMIDRPMGYEKDGIISVRSNSYEDFHVDELRQLSCVENIGFIQSDPMMNSSTYMTMNVKGEDYKMNAFYGDQQAFEILGFQVAQQLQTPKANNVWLTESAVKALGFSLDDIQESWVCGVIKDFKKGSAVSVENNQFPNVYYLMDMEGGKNYQFIRNMIVKVKGDEKEAVKELAHFYQSNPNYRAEGIRIDRFHAINENLYGAEFKNLKLLTGFSFITLALTVLSLFAMSTYYARQHTKSVALRKILGSGKSELYWSTCFNFLKPICVALVVAVPISYWLAGKWLEEYSYRVDLAFSTYFMVICIVLITAIVSVSWQTVKLMNTNPVLLLKNE